MSITKSDVKFHVRRLVPDADYICHMLIKLLGFSWPSRKACSICLMRKTTYCFIFPPHDPFGSFFFFCDISINLSGPASVENSSVFFNNPCECTDLLNFLLFSCPHGFHSSECFVSSGAYICCEALFCLLELRCVSITWKKRSRKARGLIGKTKG